MLDSVFLYTAAALACTDLIVNGVLERHPDLRLGIVELSAIWVPMFLLMLDGGVDFTTRLNGFAPAELSLRPSEYFRRQVRVSSFSYELPEHLRRQLGGADLLMACSDYPHSEGTATPIADYAAHREVRHRPRAGARACSTTTPRSSSALTPAQRGGQGGEHRGAEPVGGLDHRVVADVLEGHERCLGAELVQARRHRVARDRVELPPDDVQRRRVLLDRAGEPALLEPAVLDVADRAGRAAGGRPGTRRAPSARRARPGPRRPDARTFPPPRS